jgi:hypothetical protein
MEENKQPGIINSISEAASAGMASVKETAQNAVASVTDNLNSYSSGDNVGTSDASFLDSNGYVAKLSFFFLILLLFLFLLHLGVKLIQYFLTPSRSPYLIKGMISGSSAQTISQKANNQDALIVYRSNDRPNGIEFTWSTWLLIDDVGSDENTVRHIFHKGMNDGYGKANTLIQNVGSYRGYAYPNNGPGLYLDGKLNKMYFVMDVISPTGPSGGTVQFSVKIDVDDVPMKKWFHIAFRLQNKVLDIYTNGTIVKRISFEYIPKQNYDDVYLGQNGGFSGSISNLRYYDYALSAFELSNIVYWGPNLTASNLMKNSGKNYDFLGATWYQSKWN